jgi:hypothetical protein
MPDNNKLDLEGLCAFIWQLEKVNELLALKRLGAPCWPMVRMRVFYSLAVCMNLYKNPHPFKHGVVWILKYIGGVVINTGINFVKINKLLTAEILIFEHPRTKKHKGQLIDIYSYYFANEKLKELPGNKVLIMSRTLNGWIEKNDSITRFNIDAIEIGRVGLGVLFSRILPFWITDSHLSQAPVSRKPDSRCLKKIKPLLKRGWVEYIFTFAAYRFLFFFARKASELVLIDGYSSRAGLIAAAKKAGMKVVEIQHGVIGEYHLGYSYPISFNLNYLPDELLVWSDSWKREIESVWPGKIEIFPNYYLLEQIEEYKNKYSRIENSIVVISQGTISQQLSQLILKNISHLGDYKIHYKLHPSELASWKNNTTLRKLNEYESVSIVESDELFALFAQCEYQLGVYSTALFEGREFGCKTILANLPGVEYMKNYKPDYWFDDFIGIIEN